MTTAAVIRREILWLIIAVPAGVLLLPVLVWLAGARVFGPYAGGEAGDLMNRFFQGLGQGDLAFWLLAAGPYALLLLLRILIHQIK